MDNVHFPQNTFDLSGEHTKSNAVDACSKPEYMHQVRQLADEHSLNIHLDGARLFNASRLPLNVTPAIACFLKCRFCQCVFIQGAVCTRRISVLCGSEAFIHEARRIRKMLGGGMRQCGIIAGPGLVAIDEMIDRS